MYGVETGGPAIETECGGEGERIRKKKENRNRTTSFNAQQSSIFITHIVSSACARKSENEKEIHRL